MIGISDFSYTIIEEVPRSWIKMLFMGPKVIDLVGFNNGRLRRFFEQEQFELTVVDRRVRQIIPRERMEQAAEQLSLICGKPVTLNY